MKDAPSPIINNDLNNERNFIKFLNQGFNAKLSEKNYIIKIGILKDTLFINVISNEIKDIYQSHLTFEELKNISKSMRYFDDINDVATFIENKGRKSEIFLKKEQNEIFINFKVTSPNGKEEDILLKLKPKDLNDKEKISFLLIKVDNLEKEIQILKERIKASDNIISEYNFKFSKIFSEIQLLKNQILNKNSDEKKNNIIDSKITNEKEIDFIINYLKESSIINNKNLKFELLYRGSRDGDDTVNLHKKCCGYKNVIIFMKSEEGKKFGGFTNIGWETRDRGKWEYPIDDNAFLFSLDRKKLFKAQKGKNKMCWINSDEYGLSFYRTLFFYNHYMTIKKKILGDDLENNFIGCHKSDFNSGIESSKFSELEIFKIN